MQPHIHVFDEIRASLRRDIVEHSEMFRPPPVLRVSPYVASSLMQKAIRRGDALLAQRAAVTLHRMRGPAVWRRLLVISFEDIGVGSPSCVMAATAASLERSKSTDEAAISFVAKLLADAPKDRTSDHLLCSAQAHPSLTETRRLIESCSLSGRMELLADTFLSLPIRSLAVLGTRCWSAGVAGTNGADDLTAMEDVFAALGVPTALIHAAKFAAMKTKEPICLLVPLIFQASMAEKTNVIACQVPKAPEIDGIPLYALDKFTAEGKAAIHRFARQNTAVCDALSRYAPAGKAGTAAGMAIFCIEGMAVSRRLDWSQSRALEVLGTENDMLVAGVAKDGIEPVLAAVRDNLDDLNKIRADVFRPRRARDAE